MKNMHITSATLALALSLGASAQETGEGTFDGASKSLHDELQDSLRELTVLREEIRDDMVPLSRRLAELEAELAAAEAEGRETTRTLDSRTLRLTNLSKELEKTRDEESYLSNLFGQYRDELAARLHVAEDERYREVVEAAVLAPDNGNLSQREVYAAQAALFDRSLDRIAELLGGTRFDGAAVDPAGMVREGTYVLVGPSAIFSSSDGRILGSVDQPLNSNQPVAVPFGDPADALSAEGVIRVSTGRFPLDPTLGNALKIEATDETLLEHVKKGGPVMIPIFALAALALLIALYKWASLSLLPMPSKRRIGAFLEAVGRRERPAIQRSLEAIRGPIRTMLAAGVEHMDEPRELTEEVMYETVLTTRLRVQSFLPFIAICAASAPLLGLLGTVTGIINTFKMIELFGSGDVKSLSGGISEALITTKFGLIVAIPSLLLHAFLSRKARRVVSEMEAAAVGFVNKLGTSAWAAAAPDHRGRERDERHVAEQVRDALDELLVPMLQKRLDELGRSRLPQAAGATSEVD